MFYLCTKKFIFCKLIDKSCFTTPSSTYHKNVPINCPWYEYSSIQLLKYNLKYSDQFFLCIKSQYFYRIFEMQEQLFFVLVLKYYLKHLIFHSFLVHLFLILKVPLFPSNFFFLQFFILYLFYIHQFFLMLNDQKEVK